ncbi:branched-chain amino acid ABC transporter permease [Mesorhizobium sp. B2-6-1]|uniref:branched-chain amino acid ABC transporter permease n=1 Tax=Mesorhizobium sp. B2-6-1 TaxID=2589916 RepID=UPI00112A1FF6|nr:branched-chain amino acid ABC transporter permease [Mesorhizobium sp. B2-6-1]TPJ57616.1 branched-chain amino acid ABC transporter permease [Mesorhizobium sp. B2-6-1]
MDFTTEIAQLVVNGLMAGAILAVPAIAFSLIFAVLQISNFALAAHIAVGAYTAYMFNVVFGMPAIVSVFAAFLVSGLVGVASDHIALKPLRSYGPLSVAIASMALNMVLENFLRFGFGNDVQGLDVLVYRDWILGDVHIAPQQFYNFLIAAVIMALLFCLLTFTSIGKAMRAVADNPGLADIKGINPEQISRLAVFISMGLAGVGGVLIALDAAIEPTIGFRVILSVFAAAVLGGLGNIPGAVAGALIIGVAEEVSLLAMPVAYRSAIGFIAIIIALLFFPRGILSKR